MLELCELLSNTSALLRCCMWQEQLCCRRRCQTARWTSWTTAVTRCRWSDPGKLPNLSWTSSLCRASMVMKAQRRVCEGKRWGCGEGGGILVRDEYLVDWWYLLCYRYKVFLFCFGCRLLCSDMNALVWKKWLNVVVQLAAVGRKKKKTKNCSTVLSWINIDWGRLLLFCECVGNSVKYSFLKLWNGGKLQPDDNFTQKWQKCGWTMRDCCTRGTLYLVHGLYLFNRSILFCQGFVQESNLRL